jgi:aminoglycoside phosphotransferase (APT) family kinase protein
MDVDEGSNVARWSGPAFRAEATSWVASACEARGLELAGAGELSHCRPWSSAMRFATDGGRVWLKANGPGTSHEPALVAVLAGLVPDLVPEVLAVDVERGWSLTRDAGAVMRSGAPREELWSRWEGVLPRYAAAQITLADHLPELAGTGVRRLGPESLPEEAAALTEELAALDPEAGGLSTEEASAVAARLPTYARWCAELGASGIPLSLQHDDLHSGNICWTGSVRTARVIDWGDACLGHPLATMLCTLNSVSHHAKVPLDDDRVRRVRDAYLEPFTRYADDAALVRYVGLARRTGCVGRALSWRAALHGERPATHRELGFPVRGWLLELLEEETVATG